MENCIFCKIIKKELPAKIIEENEKIIVFEDIHPSAPIHLLIVPKKHISSINELEENDKELIGDMFLMAKRVAKKMNLVEQGYKLIFNVGKGAGQVIFHIHLHLISGWKTVEKAKKTIL